MEYTYLYLDALPGDLDQPEASGLGFKYRDGTWLHKSGALDPLCPLLMYKYGDCTDASTLHARRESQFERWKTKDKDDEKTNCLHPTKVSVVDSEPSSAISEAGRAKGLDACTRSRHKGLIQQVTCSQASSGRSLVMV
ncbi:hypothetical protein M440DRAFT_1227975 [Trichoderma longibrachiatum ATCC 18648]|uniref:Uncharacterized protein n=1 Tax=Trichoderma longibrachiatum ATCC 18648 TaxID=983965 RepID=A0A2T4C8T7_TRILO|nr:hypothetical protein M440DRAFT_1227975 [Trichoderma longibrachiatum ATCC 18648]